MRLFDCENSSKKKILALGAESAGNFSFFSGGKIFSSADFGDLLDEGNFAIFQKAVLAFLKKEAVQPDVILTDLHPLMKTALWGQQLAKKYKAAHIQVQHHHAHIFSAIGEQSLQTKNYKLKTAFGIAMDGTGYGEDERIWGGEVFQLKTTNYKLQTIRIGHLENQTLLGGELAIQEPARMVISILSKFLSKKETYSFVKKYYSAQEFEMLYNQLQQNFNCLETSSAGRVLDAISLLLGFCENVRNYKHEAIDLLEKNSTEPYTDLKPKIIQDVGGKYILDTTYLFNYVIKYLHKDKKRLAATAQLYLAEGLYEIIQKENWRQTKNPCLPAGRQKLKTTSASGGITHTKIISQYFASKNIYLSKTIPRGDAGLSFGQIAYFLSANNL